jgi:hypothetical protein
MTISTPAAEELAALTASLQDEYGDSARWLAAHALLQLDAAKIQEQAAQMTWQSHIIYQVGDRCVKLLRLLLKTRQERDNAQAALLVACQLLHAANRRIKALERERERGA